MQDVKKVPVYRKEGDVFVKVGEISEQEAKDYVSGEPDIEEVDAVYILGDEEQLPEEEESKVHKYRIP